MPSIRPITRRLALLAVATATLAACGDDPPVAPTSVDGRYVATTFRVTPTGEAPLDILALGGSLAVTLGPANAMTGTLIIPSLSAEQAAINDTTTGTFVRTGNTIRLNQSFDRFLNDLEWTFTGRSLAVVAQQAGSATFSITLTRE